MVILLTLFGGFLAHFYSTQTEKSYASHLRSIAREINQMNTSWKANEDINENMTLERAKKLASLIVTEAPAEIEHIENVLGSETIPESFDSRVQWPNCQSIKEIRDQSACGSCWAFGASETMSDRICIGSGQKDQTRISSADLVSCCHFCGNGCDGGFLYQAFLYWRYNGLVTGDLYDSTTAWCKPYPFPACAHHVHSASYPDCPSTDYPTPACKKECQSGYPTPYSKDLHFAKHIYTTSGAANIAKEVSTNGPVETAFTVYDDFLTYKSGVYVHKTGQELGGHAVKIIGYGTENGLDYWLIANSWNPTWGDNGFFKILRGKNECGVEDKVVAGFPATD